MLEFKSNHDNDNASSLGPALIGWWAHNSASRRVLASTLPGRRRRRRHRLQPRFRAWEKETETKHVLQDWLRLRSYWKRHSPPARWKQRAGTLSIKEQCGKFVSATSRCLLSFRWARPHPSSCCCCCCCENLTDMDKFASAAHDPLDNKTNNWRPTMASKEDPTDQIALRANYHQSSSNAPSEAAPAFECSPVGRKFCCLLDLFSF